MAKSPSNRLRRALLFFFFKHDIATATRPVVWQTLAVGSFRWWEPAGVSIHVCCDHDLAVALGGEDVEVGVFIFHFSVSLDLGYLQKEVARVYKAVPLGQQLKLVERGHFFSFSLFSLAYACMDLWDVCMDLRNNLSGHADVDLAVVCHEQVYKAVGSPILIFQSAEVEDWLVEIFRDLKAWTRPKIISREMCTAVDSVSCKRYLSLSLPSVSS